MIIKTGIGFDAHAFGDGKKLILGGTHIPYNMGMIAHSDGDVLAHAIIDSFVGVCLGKDIGCLYPDSDATYKNADSLLLLANAIQLITNAGYKIIHTDAVIIAQQPKMMPHIMSMRENLANAMMLTLAEITVKATTTEYLGFTGRKEGIAVVAVSTIGCTI